MREVANQLINIFVSVPGTGKFVYGTSYMYNAGTVTEKTELASRCRMVVGVCLKIFTQILPYVWQIKTFLSYPESSLRISFIYLS